MTIATASVAAASPSVAADLSIDPLNLAARREAAAPGATAALDIKKPGLSEKTRGRLSMVAKGAVYLGAALTVGAACAYAYKRLTQGGDIGEVGGVVDAATAVIEPTA